MCDPMLEAQEPSCGVQSHSEYSLSMTKFSVLATNSTFTGIQPYGAGTAHYSLPFLSAKTPSRATPKPAPG